MHLHITPIVFDCPPSELDPPGRVLKMTVKWYWTDDSLANEDGFSLLFAHCIGGHKELWEPTIEAVFAAQHAKPRHQRVREAWAFDWQSHGDAAVLNRAMLRGTRQFGVSASEWAAAISAFIRSARMRAKRMVAIGHSAGAAALLLAAKYASSTSHQHPYSAIVLIEPSLATRPMFYKHIAPFQPAVVVATQLRRQRWGSQAEAEGCLRRKAPWRGWDARVLRKFLEYGLAPTPSGHGAVMLKCDRRQEALAFSDVEPHFASVDELGKVSGVVPVHLVWGTRSDIVPRVVQDALSDASKGRVAASITRIEGGHLLVQESPDRVARAICSALDAVGVFDLGMQSPARSRL